MYEGTYKFVVGAGNAIAMDQTNNGVIAGNEANFVLPGGTRVDFGPGFTVRIITPNRLFDEPMGDEVTRFDILFGGNIDLDVPFPQNTVPGYTFNMVSERGGVRSGLTKYGILFTWDQDSDADDLRLIVPGAYSRRLKGGAAGEVYISLERAVLMKKPPGPAPTAKCNDGIITKPEYCDPPGSFCVGTQAFERGTCAADCNSCIIAPVAKCGNKLLEKGEECESIADCPVGFDCKGCKCAALPVAVCGNNLIDLGEDCEKNVDCAPGMMCQACDCVPAPAPVVEVPAPAPQPNMFARFWNWFKGVFGF